MIAMATPAISTHDTALPWTVTSRHLTAGRAARTVPEAATGRGEAAPKRRAPRSRRPVRARRFRRGRAGVWGHSEHLPASIRARGAVTLCDAGTKGESSAAAHGGCEPAGGGTRWATGPPQESGGTA
jgi:hypothetical protein